jgi:hypothetical protein
LYLMPFRLAIRGKEKLLTVNNCHTELYLK